MDEFLIIFDYFVYSVQHPVAAGVFSVPLRLRLWLHRCNNFNNSSSNNNNNSQAAHPILNFPTMPGGRSIRYISS